MVAQTNQQPIPKEAAKQICDEIRAKKQKRLFSQCWGCVKFSKGDFSKMCLAGREDLRGCSLVNKEYDERFSNR